ncbi:hypothetical protein F8388_009387 [Cannabis sativa]|uniref:Uncharacterized protein n=1 Tax=Cannabis sativa TaxID=3483 RepID=A0A7J6GW76_CANSA|nr:hypothetical protein F8388_009387 [Cannabis sativa]KAF4387173.1 hypothetical protein G4B88_024745 [Cannabis sativa]
MVRWSKFATIPSTSTHSPSTAPPADASVATTSDVYPWPPAVSAKSLATMAALFFVTQGLVS